METVQCYGYTRDTNSYCCQVPFILVKITSDTQEISVLVKKIIINLYWYQLEQQHNVPRLCCFIFCFTHVRTFETSAHCKNNDCKYTPVLSFIELKEKLKTRTKPTKGEGTQLDWLGSHGSVQLALSSRWCLTVTEEQKNMRTQQVDT